MMGLLGAAAFAGADMLRSRRIKDAFDTLNSAIKESSAYSAAMLGSIATLSDATRNSNINVLNSLSGQALSLLVPYLPTYAQAAQQNPGMLNGYTPMTTSTAVPGTGAPVGSPAGASPPAQGSTMGIPGATAPISGARAGPGINIGYRFDNPSVTGNPGVARTDNPSPETNPAANTGLLSIPSPQPPPPPDFARMQADLEAKYNSKMGSALNTKSAGQQDFLQRQYNNLVQKPLDDAKAQYQTTVDQFYNAQKQAKIDARNQQIADLKLNVAPNVAPVNASVINAPANAPNQGALIDWQQMKGMLDKATNYQIQLGNEAVQNSAAAQGMLNSGNTLAALQERAQNTANSLVFPYYQQGITNYNQNVLAQNQINSNYQSNLNNALAGIYNQNTSAAIQAQLGQVNSATQKAIAEQSVALGGAGILGQLGSSVAGENTAATTNIANASLANAQRYSNEQMALAQMAFDMLDKGVS